jgi:cysteine desulfurase/selenocysteine lyase
MSTVLDPTTYPVDRIRSDFPVLDQTVNGQPLVYLDNGATTQKPSAVIDAMADFLRHDYGTVRRGVYALSVKATQAYEGVRSQVARFMNAPSTEQIIFTKGTTEAVNLVATGYGAAFLKPGDEVVITQMEHHANWVPWQQVCLRTGATLKLAPITDEGVLDLDALAALLTPNTKLVAVTHVSNVLGTVNPIQQIVEMAHQHGAVVFVDGAQAAPHTAIDVQALGCDFYAFSGHKLYGPTGVGVLYGKTEHLLAMQPYQFGGDMIDTVSFEKTTFAKPPAKFEAGTPPITEVIGLGAALQYVTDLGLPAIAAHEHHLLTLATDALQALPGLRIIGTAPNKASVISFVLEDIHPHDVGTLLDGFGIAVRAGHHCAQPLMERFKVPATTRASFGIYNTERDIDALVAGIQRVQALFG